MTRVAGLTAGGAVWLSVLLVAALGSWAERVTSLATDEHSSTSVSGRGSPDELLQFYIDAQESKDISMYQQALHRQYQYWLDPETADSLGWRPEKARLSRRVDVCLAEELFCNPAVGKIRMQLLPLTGWQSCVAVVPGEFGRDEAFQGMQITVNPIIDIETVGSGGATTVTEVNRSYMHFIVVPDVEVPGAWLILQVKEVLQSD